MLAILPTATENILEAIPVEQVLEELQRQKAQRLARSVGPSEIGTSAPPSVADAPSVADTTEDDSQSVSVQTEGYVHASQVVVEGAEGENATVPSAETTAAPTSEPAEPAAPAVPEAVPQTKEEKTSNAKSKAQLWNEMKIGCEYHLNDI